MSTRPWSTRSAAVNRMPPSRRSVTTCAWCSRICRTFDVTTPSTSRTTDIAVIPRDADPEETQEWLEALEAVLREDGPERAQQLIDTVVWEARGSGAPVEVGLTTPYVNTIPPDREQKLPGDYEVERRLRSILRWNAMQMVLRANAESSELGGHIASYNSIATLFEVGFNHFWHAPSEQHGGDLVYMQGHSSPGIYARAFLEGRFSEQQLRGFRQEVSRDGIPSYPHPWLIPHFWQCPSVAMDLGPL